MYISGEGKVGLGLTAVLGIGAGAAMMWPEQRQIGVIVMAISAIALILLIINHLHESGKGKRMVPLFGMMVCGVGLVFFCSWYFRSSSNSVTGGASADQGSKRNLSFQKLALFWVQRDEGNFQIGAVSKLFNADMSAHFINGMLFDGDNWSFVPRGSYYLRKFWGFEDHIQVLEDNYIKAGSEAYFKKLLPIHFDMKINYGDTPEFIMRGTWKAYVGDTEFKISPAFYSVYPSPISG